MTKVALDVIRKCICGFVPARSVLFQGLENNPIQISTQLGYGLKALEKPGQQLIE
jgi:hypothetical protein